MCDPISASLALTVAGSAAQAAGQAKAQKAMHDAQNAERLRQAGLQGKSNELLSESLASSDRGQHDASQAQAEAARKASYDQAAASTPSPVSDSTPVTAGDTNANKLVNTESAARSAQAMGMANQQGGAKAALQGFNDVNLGDILYNNRMLQKQGTIGNFMQGSAGVLPYEMDAASRKGSGLKTFGDILSLGGTAVGLGAGSGMFAPADQMKTITSSLDMSKFNPSAYGVNSASNPLFNPANQPAMYQGLNQSGNFMKYFKPIR